MLNRDAPSFIYLPQWDKPEYLQIVGHKIKKINFVLLKNQFS
jgi:hypothetical protein